MGLTTIHGLCKRWSWNKIQPRVSYIHDIPKIDCKYTTELADRKTRPIKRRPLLSKRDLSREHTDSIAALARDCLRASQWHKAMV